MTDLRENYLDGFEEQVRQETQKRKAADQMKTLDDRIVDLTDKAATFALEYGTEDYRTQLMTTFLDVALNMKEVVKMLQGVQVGIQCLGETIGFLDDFMQDMDVMQKESLEHKYGLFARIKRRIRLSRVRRNNKRRVKAVMSGVMASVRMASDIGAELKRSMAGMVGTFDKFNNKGKKKKGAAPTGPSAAQILISEAIAKKQSEGAADNGKGSYYSPKPASAPSDTGDISDILP